MENKNVHLSHLVFIQAKKYGDRPAMYFRDDNTKTWLPITWNESARQVRLIGKALISIDVKEGDRVNFTVDAYPDDVIQGTVKQVRLEATTTNNVVTYEVVISGNVKC